MPGPLLHVGTIATCPHTPVPGLITTTPPNFITSNFRVFVSGMPALTMIDILPVAGCPVNLCATARFFPATRVFINSQPAVINMPGMGICQDASQGPQGPPVVAFSQLRVVGT